MPQNDLVSADFCNRAFTLHGTVMMFPLAVPAFEAVAIFLLPPMLGARAAVSEARVHSASEASSPAEFLSAVRSFSTLPSSGWFIYPPLAPTSEAGELRVVNERDEIGSDLLPDREGSRLLWLAYSYYSRHVDTRLQQPPRLDLVETPSFRITSRAAYQLGWD